MARRIGTGTRRVKTRNAARARVWQRAPGRSEFDAAANVRLVRNEDIEIVRRNAEHQKKHLGSEAEGAAAGKKLLKHMGL